MLSRRAALLPQPPQAPSLLHPHLPPRPRRSLRTTLQRRKKPASRSSSAIHATWCPTCKAQKPILSELMAEPEVQEFGLFCRRIPIARRTR